MQGWSVRVGDSEPIFIEGSTLEWEIAEESPIEIDAVFESGGITSADIDANFFFDRKNGMVKGEGTLTAYNLAGRMVAQGVGTISLPSRGIYIIADNQGRTMKVAY